MLPDTDMLAAALERLSRAADALQYADVARRAVTAIETAAQADRRLADVSVPVTLTSEDSTYSGHFLAEARLAVIRGEVNLVRTPYVPDADGEVFRGWWTLLDTVRNDVVHALPALTDAFTASLLSRAETIKSNVLKAQRARGSTDG